MGRRSWLALVTAVAGSLTAPADVPAQDALVVRGATVIDGTGADPVADGIVVVRDGRIACVGPRDACEAPAGARTIDASGKWITPGLVDAHVHFSQTGWVDGRPDAVDAREIYPYEEVAADLRARPERWHRAYLCSGITAVFDVGGFPWTWALRDDAEGNPMAAHVAAAGPLVTHAPLEIVRLPAERQFIDLESAEAGRDAVDYMAANGSDAVKVWYLSSPPEERADVDARVAAVGEAAEASRVPLIVHATELRVAKKALEAGADLLVHSVTDSVVDQEFLDLAKENGTVYTPTLTVFEGYYRTFRSILENDPIDLDDPNGCVDPATRDKVRAAGDLREIVDFPPDRLEAFRQRIERMDEVTGENLRRVHAAGIPVATGTDAGNPGTVHGPAIYAEMEAMQAAGLAPMDVIVATTRDAARAMGRLDDLGTLEESKVADLLVVAADPLADVGNFRQVETVVRGGTVHEVADLGQ